ncbi:crAss001_48 related protein [Empedobacter falsenii]
MKSFIKKTSWFSRIILLLLFINFCFCEFKVYQSIYYDLPDFVVAIYGIKSTISLGVLLVYGFIQHMGTYIQKKEYEPENTDENFYSEFPPHQQRVFEERDELEVKYIKLTNFIFSNPFFKELNEVEQLALKEQNSLMEQYLAVLNKRISRF